MVAASAAIDSTKVSRFVGAHASDRNHGRLPLFADYSAYILETAFGQDAVEPYRRQLHLAGDILVNRYLAGRPIRQVLSLCCGFGSLERILLPRLPEVTDCRALDIAPGAISTARRLAAEAGLTAVRYEVADLNAWLWQSKQYDLVVANGALHHLRNLEDVLAGVRRTLKPGGAFVSCECVGPNYQDHSPRQLELINAAAFLVPAELRARTGSAWHRHPAIFRALTRLRTAAACKDQTHWPEWKKLAARATRRLARRRPSTSAWYTFRPNRTCYGPIHRSASAPRRSCRRYGSSFPRRKSIPWAGGCWSLPSTLASTNDLTPITTSIDATSRWSAISNAITWPPVKSAATSPSSSRLKFPAQPPPAAQSLAKLPAVVAVLPRTSDVAPRARPCEPLESHKS